MQFIILMCCVVSIIISVLCLTVSMKNKNTDEYKRVNQQLDMMSQTFAAQISTLYDQLNRQNNLMVNNITALGRELRESQETQQGRAKEQLVNAAMSFSTSLPDRSRNRSGSYRHVPAVRIFV